MVHDGLELVELRTELALLRRISALVHEGRIRGPVCPHKYGDDDREELRRIIHSADDPIVSSMIEVVDREFGNVRTRIVMSAVHDEAARIVAEAVESGAVASPATEQYRARQEATPPQSRVPPHAESTQRAPTSDSPQSATTPAPPPPVPSAGAVRAIERDLEQIERAVADLSEALGITRRGRPDPSDVPGPDASTPPSQAASPTPLDTPQATVHTAPRVR